MHNKLVLYVGYVLFWFRPHRHTSIIEALEYLDYFSAEYKLSPDIEGELSSFMICINFGTKD